MIAVVEFARRYDDVDWISVKEKANFKRAVLCENAMQDWYPDTADALRMWVSISSVEMPDWDCWMMDKETLYIKAIPTPDVKFPLEYLGRVTRAVLFRILGKTDEVRLHSLRSDIKFWVKVEYEKR